MIGSAISLLANAAGIHSWFSGIRSGRIQEALLREAERTRHSIERLSDHVVSVRSIVEVKDRVKDKQSCLEDNQKICELMTPIQRGVGEDILTTAVVLTPEKLQNALSKDPWGVLVEIRPVGRAKRPTNPDMVPIVFNDGSGLYVGWQMKGALPMLLDCEYIPDRKLYLSYSDDDNHNGPIKISVREVREREQRRPREVSTAPQRAPDVPQRAPDVPQRAQAPKKAPAVSQRAQAPPKVPVVPQRVQAPPKAPVVPQRVQAPPKAPVVSQRAQAPKKAQVVPQRAQAPKKAQVVLQRAQALPKTPVVSQRAQAPPRVPTEPQSSQALKKAQAEPQRAQAPERAPAVSQRAQAPKKVPAEPQRAQAPQPGEPIRAPHQAGTLERLWGSGLASRVILSSLQLISAMISVVFLPTSIVLLGMGIFGLSIIELMMGLFFIVISSPFIIFILASSRAYKSMEKKKRRRERVNPKTDASEG